MSFLLIFLIFVAVTFFIVQPLFTAEKTQIIDKTEALNSLQQQKTVLYQQIKELETDYLMGNLHEEDYLKARHELKAEVSSLMKKMK